MKNVGNAKELVASLTTTIGKVLAKDATITE
jgi:hypothetical protein